MKNPLGGPRRLRPHNFLRLPPRARRYVLAVDALALLILGLLVSTVTWRPADCVAFGVFAGCAVVSVESFRRVGATHRQSNRPYHDLLAACVFPAAIVLPPAFGALLPIAAYGLIEGRVNRLPLVKRVFNTAMFILTAAGAALAHDAIAPPLSRVGLTGLGSNRELVALATAGLVYLLINKVLIIGIIRKVAPATPWKALIGDREGWALNIVDVCAGIVLAVAWSLSPFLVVVALAPILLLQRALVYTHLVEAVRTDSKTGLANPAYWRQEAGRAVARAQRVGLAVSVLVVDLDRFKIINDHHGHLAGDAVLAAVADTLRLSVRPGDLVARFGGEEFTVLLVGADRQTGAAVGERIRDQLAKMSCPLPGDGCRVRVTASVGLAVWGEDGLDLEALLGAADAAMYQAKAAGGNCMRLAAPSLTQPGQVEVVQRPAVS